MNSKPSSPCPAFVSFYRSYFLSQLYTQMYTLQCLCVQSDALSLTRGSEEERTDRVGSIFISANSKAFCFIISSINVCMVYWLFYFYGDCRCPIKTTTATSVFFLNLFLFLACPFEILTELSWGMRK